MFRKLDFEEKTPRQVWKILNCGPNVMTYLAFREVGTNNRGLYSGSRWWCDLKVSVFTDLLEF